MTQAISPSGAVAFGYDSLGRVSSKLFTDDQLGVYVESRVKSEILCECQTGEHGLLVGQAVAA